jgi:hypothetical protein
LAGQEDAASDTASDDVSLPQNPQLSLTKDGTWNDGPEADGFADPGETISYSFTVTNDGNVTLANLDLSDAGCDAAPAYVSGDDGDGLLQVGESWTFSCQTTIDQADIDAGTVHNSAAATADGPLAGQEDAASDTASDDVSLPQNPQLSLTKSASPNTYNAVGQVISYTFTLKNTGNVTLSGPFSVADDRTTNESCPSSATLAPGGILICTATYSITQADINSGSVTNVATASGSFDSLAVTSSAASETVRVQLRSNSALTHSAAKSTTEISNQLVPDFEVLLNGQNVVVATNPGQFFYHQWAANPYTITTNWDFNLDWTSDFVAQTTGGQALKAFIQVPGASGFTNWTSHATAVCWSVATGCPNSHTGRIKVQDVPAGATVWVMAHLDYSHKGESIGTVSPNPMIRPVVYGPLTSAITITDESNHVIGASSSGTYVVGRGKKVTMVYGSATDNTGTLLPNTWIRVKQGTNSAITMTDSAGGYLFFDGQLCAAGDMIFGGCSGWTTAISFGKNTVATTVEFLGNAATQSVTPQFPSGYSKADVRTASQSSPLTTITSPAYTFSVKQGDAYNRDYRFKP